MLKTRVITAIILLAVLIPCLFYLPHRAWGGVVALAAVIGAWEWGGFMQVGPRWRVVMGFLLAALCLALLLFLPQLFNAVEVATVSSSAIFLYAPAAVFWLFLVPFWMHFKWPLPKGGIGLVVGLLVILPTWAALVHLRLLGAWQLLAILAVVWVADSAAYLFGRLFGRHKLAVTISPGKTWEGALGAAGSVLLYGLVMRQVFDLQHTPLYLWIIGLPALTALSIVGDLFESLLKRQAGLKDSSQVLPGHGGILDRIDSLTSTLPSLMFVSLLFTRP